MTDIATQSAFDTAIGRTENVSDTLDRRQARHMQLTLDEAPSLDVGDPLPAFWHYLYFNPQIRASDLGADGHEKLGRFIPDFGLPRRMWAGGRVTIDKPLCLGETADKTSTIRSIEQKTGRSGDLCFVTVDHDFSVRGEYRFRETQNIVYRAPPAPGSSPPSGKPAPDDWDFEQRVTPDEVMLFRYSALIFYGHRIHYDSPYTRGTEGYPGLVVHGPLTATLLLRLGLRHLGEKSLGAFDIRAMNPLFVNSPVILQGRHTDNGAALWARTPEGNLAMTVTLHARP